MEIDERAGCELGMIGERDERAGFELGTGGEKGKRLATMALSGESLMCTHVRRGQS